MAKTLTKRQFIKKARKIHGNRYDYSKVIYINSYTNVIIICHIHGEFQQRPDCHLSGQGCKYCTYDSLKTSLLDFITKANDIHKNKFDYSLFKYKTARIKGKIICKDCESIFEQSPSVHLRSRGCPECYRLNRNIVHQTKLTTNEVIMRFRAVHGDIYGYEHFIYKNNNTKGIMYCYKHGEFQQRPSSHLSGSGCPKCKSISKGEKRLMMIFEKNKIKYIVQYKLPYYNFRYDFYLPDYNLLIEFHGEQHYKPIPHFKGNEGLIRTKERDAIKKSLAKEYCIPLIYFTHNHIRYNNGAFEKFVLSIIDKVRRK